MNLKKYLDQAANAFQRGYEAMETEARRHAAALEALKKSGQELTPQALGAKIESENNAFADAIDATDSKMREKVEGIREACFEEISDFYALDGAKIDEADAKLLNSGIAISAAEIESMFRKHGDNATMVRFLADYVAAHHIKGVSDEAESAFFKAKTAGEREKKAVEIFLNTSRAAVEMVRGGAAFSKAYYTAVDNIGDYALIAEKTILKAALFLSDNEKRRLEEIEKIFEDKENAARAKRIEASRSVIDHGF